MIVNVSFNEILDFVQGKFKFRPVLKAVGAKCVEISYKPSPFLPEIGVTLKILGLRKDIVCFSYECGTAASMLICGVVEFLQTSIPDGVCIDTLDKRVDIYPERLRKLEKVFAHVELEDIVFDEASVNVALKLRD